MQQISELIVRMAQENPGWGYTRIQGALANVNYRVGRGTVANVLKRNGIEPSPERGKRTQWSTFLKTHWKVLFAADSITTVDWRRNAFVPVFGQYGLASRILACRSTRERVIGRVSAPRDAHLSICGRRFHENRLRRPQRGLRSIGNIGGELPT